MPLGVVQFARTLAHHRIGGGLLALARDDLGLGTGDRIDRLPGLSPRLVALRIEYVDLHLGQRLTDLHEIAFIDRDGLDASAQLGGNVDFGGLDPAVATRETGARAGRFQCDPDQNRADHDGRSEARHEQLLFERWRRFSI